MTVSSDGVIGRRSAPRRGRWRGKRKSSGDTRRKLIGGGVRGSAVVAQGESKKRRGKGK